jgi:RNA recognition motif-containing protein
VLVVQEVEEERNVEGKQSTLRSKCIGSLYFILLVFRNRGSQFRVSISNLASSVSWQDLKDYLRAGGDVVHTEVDRRGRGIASFSSLKEMDRAIDKLDDSELAGQRIRLREVCLSYYSILRNSLFFLTYENIRNVDVVEDARALVQDLVRIHVLVLVQDRDLLEEEEVIDDQDQDQDHNQDHIRVLVHLVEECHLQDLDLVLRR